MRASLLRVRPNKPSPNRIPDRRLTNPPRALRIACLMLALTQALFTAGSATGSKIASGEIRGTVTGASHPLVGATVRLLEPELAARTDDKGAFAFLNVPSGSYTLFVRAIGYASVSRTVNVSESAVDASVDLRESAIGMEEVVVSASPGARTTDELFQSAESKSIVEFHGSPGSSFAEKISDMPGVTVRGFGSAPSRPVLRGLSDNRVLVLENGLRMGDIATYDPAHATPIDAMSISQIDVVRGPAGIEFGPSTIGGLVNVMTDLIPAAAQRPFSGTISLSGNTVNDEYSGSFNGVYSGGGHAFGLSGGGLHSQDIRIPSAVYTDPGTGDSFQLERMPQSFNHSSQFGAGYSYEGEFGMFGFAGKHYEMNYGIPGTPPNPNFTVATSRIDQKRNSAEFRGRFNVNGSLVEKVKVNATYTDYNHSEYPTVQDSTGVFEFLATHFHKQEFNGSVQFAHHQSGGFRGTFGIWSNIEDMTLDGDQPLGPNSLTTGLAAYLLEEYSANEATRLQAGLRFDDNRIHARPEPASTDSLFQTFDAQRTADAVTFSLGAIRSLGRGLSCSFNVGRSFRAPTVQELFADGLDAPSGTYTIGNADLSPETGIGVDASLKGSFEDVTFEISPYLNFIDNYIYGFLTGDTVLDFPVRKFAAATARLAGFEAGISVQPAPFIAVKLTADYVNAQDTRADQPLPFTPPLRGSLRVAYRNSMYDAMIDWRLAASQTRLGEGDTPTEGYGVVNVGAGVRLTQDGVVHHISLHCDNLMNQTYRDHLSVIKDFIPQPARGFRLNYDLLF